MYGEMRYMVRGFEQEGKDGFLMVLRLDATFSRGMIVLGSRMARSNLGGRGEASHRC